MATKYTLNIKAKDTNLDSKNFSIGYVNPSGSESMFRTLAQKIVGLSNLTLNELYLTRVSDVTNGTFFLGKFQIISTTDLFSKTYSTANAKMNALKALVPSIAGTAELGKAQFLGDNGVVYEKAVTYGDVYDTIILNCFDMKSNDNPNTQTLWNQTSSNPDVAGFYAPSVNVQAKPITLTTYSITVAESGDGKTFMNAYLKEIYDNADAQTKTYFPNAGSEDYSLVLPLKGV